jgi:ankyrin repeat protein
MTNEEAPSAENFDDSFKDIDLNILDTVGKEFTLKVLGKILKIMKDKMGQEKSRAMLDEIDQYGYSLIHYFTEIDYHECIKVLVSFGVDINKKALNEQKSYPLLIAAARGHEKSVQVLI